jgi:hypothetical protein
MHAVEAKWHEPGAAIQARDPVNSLYSEAKLTNAIVLPMAFNVKRRLLREPVKRPDPRAAQKYAVS